MAHPEPIEHDAWYLLDPSVRWLAGRVLPALQRLEAAMATTQEQVDALTARVGSGVDSLTTASAAQLAALADIRGDIATLKAAVEAGSTVDLASLEANVGRLEQATGTVSETAAALKGLAEENPPPEPV